MKFTNKLLLGGVIGAILITTAGVTSADHGSLAGIGRARILPIGESGVNGRVTIVDNGSEIRFIGVAHGLDPNDTYASLIYDNGSVATGSHACEPTIFDPTNPGFIIPKMLVGFWKVFPNGTGLLIATNTNAGTDYVPLSKFRTISIRKILGPGQSPPNILDACGEIARRII